MIPEETKVLLTNAAKAMGLELGWDYGENPPEPLIKGNPSRAAYWWNPIDSSDDCFEMCAELSINVNWNDDLKVVTCDYSDGHIIPNIAAENYENHNNDKSAAWRLCATRVAASVGKSMK